MENKVFIPMFKESDSEQFVFKNNEWIKSNESEIMSLWNKWSLLITADSFRENKFNVFGYYE
jgi:hypothetical protein